MSQVKEYLVQLGLSLNEASSLEVLLKGGSLTAKEISEESKIPYTKVYAALDALAVKGVVKYTVENPRVYHVIGNDRVFDTLIRHQESHLSVLKKRKETVMSEVNIGTKEKEEHDFDSSVWFFNTAEAIFNEVADIFSATTKGFDVATSKVGFTMNLENPRSFNQMYLLTKRKIPMRSVLSKDITTTDLLQTVKSSSFLQTTKNLYKFMSVLKSPYYVVRTLPEDELRNEFIVADKKIVGIALKDENGLIKHGIKFQNRPLAQFMHNYFEMLWEKADPIGSTWYNEVKAGLKK